LQDTNFEHNGKMNSCRVSENLLSNHCVVIHYYSENYGSKEKFELQQTYFQRTEVSIHVSVIYRHAILEVDGVESYPIYRLS
jgi:hypothetical protein